jgi:serine/threonine-protein kinase RsbW
MAPVTQLAPGDSATTDKDDVVVLAVPADGSYLAVLRTATAGLAARLRFTLDEIEDLRIAVDEACAMLLAVAPPSSELTCAFEISAETLAIMVTVPVKGTATLPGASSFSWQVLTALAGRVSADTTEDQATIRLSKARTNPG